MVVVMEPGGESGPPIKPGPATNGLRGRFMHFLPLVEFRGVSWAFHYLWPASLRAAYEAPRLWRWGMIRISRIIAELDTAIESLRELRRELIVGQKNRDVWDDISISEEDEKRMRRSNTIFDDITEDQMRRKTHQANQTATEVIRNERIGVIKKELDLLRHEQDRAAHGPNPMGKDGEPR